MEWAPGREHADELQQRCLEAILAHEIAHLHQDVHGNSPTNQIATEFDADYRAAQILADPEQLMSALQFTAFLERESETHPTVDQRVARLRDMFVDNTGVDVFLGEELSDVDRVRLRAHVEALADERDLEWREDVDVWLDGQASLEQKWFSTPPLRTEMDYFTALHEIGHHALGLETFADDNETVLFENEERVWRWAVDTAIVTPSGGARAHIVGSMHSHEGQTAPLEVRQRLREWIGDGGLDPMRYR